MRETYINRLESIKFKEGDIKVKCSGGGKMIDCIIHKVTPKFVTIELKEGGLKSTKKKQIKEVNGRLTEYIPCMWYGAYAIDQYEGDDIYGNRHQYHKRHS